MSVTQISTQLSNAKLNSIFIWYEKHTGYPRRLAAQMDRSDIQIKCLHWLNNKGCYLNKKYGDIEIIVDYHALNIMNDTQKKNLHIARSRCF